jgi:hypothetical protein
VLSSRLFRQLDEAAERTNFKFINFLPDGQLVMDHRFDPAEAALAFEDDQHMAAKQIAL